MMITPARVNPLLSHTAERRLPLDQGWRFRLDPDDQGRAAGWPQHADAIADPIRVPGSWQGQGFGGDGKDTVWDFRLEARTLRATYAGTGWYALDFAAPAAWQGQRLWLNFGGAHPSVDVWLNGVSLGSNTLPFVPFGFDVTGTVHWTGSNTLVVRVHEQNRELGFAYSWQGNWSGLYRGVDLRATGPLAIGRCRIHPDAATGRVRFDLTAAPDAPAAGRYAVQVTRCGVRTPEVAGEGALVGGAAEGELRVPAPALWSPDTPNLYRVDVCVTHAGQASDAWSERVGFVGFEMRGKQFCINGEPYYLRGTGDFLSCPETGCPDTDRERWRRKLSALRAYGYNHVRCQSYVYGPEYYDVADELGLLVQSEMGTLGAWGSHTQWHIYAWPPPTPAFREALRRQWNLIVERDVNHPSANIYCMSNELGAGTHFPRTAHRCAAETRAIKPTALVLWTDGGLNESLPQDFVNSEANREKDTSRPLVQHEFRWWSSFPDVRIAGKYSGAIRPYAAELAQKAAARHGTGHVLARAAETSQRLQFLEAKAKMEACRRDHPALAGICHFNAMDANPSPQGVIDEFYERKWADAATWQETNGDTVVLCSLGFDDRVRVGGESVACRFLVSDFSHPPWQRPTLEWALRVDEAVVTQGRLTAAHEPFRTCAWGEVAVATPVVPGPKRAVLTAVLSEGARRVTNRWDLWLMPDAARLPAGVIVYGRAEHTWVKTWLGLPSATPPFANTAVVLTERFDETLAEFARAGGRVLVAASEGLVRPFNPKFGYSLGQYFFTPPANYPPYEDGHDGTVIEPHRMLGDFPHEGFADLQFFRLMGSAPPLDLEPLGLNDGDPVVRVMHSYPVGRSLGYLTERTLGAGRLVVCALTLDQAWPEARHLLAQLCRYLAEERFPSAPELSPEALAALVSAGELP